MTTINTSEDLLRLLREDPHFYEQARRLILTDELINLPERFAAFAGRVDDFIARQEQFNERVDAFIEEQRGINQEPKATNQEQRGVNQRVERILADLRGSLTIRICRQNSDNIAAALGLSIVDHLTPAALRAMVRTSPPADAADGDLQSFYRADLIASALDQDDNEAYLAVGGIVHGRRPRHPARHPQRQPADRTHRPADSRRHRRPTHRQRHQGRDSIGRRPLVRAGRARLYAGLTGCLPECCRTAETHSRRRIGRTGVNTAVHRWRAVAGVVSDHRKSAFGTTRP